MKIHAIEFDIHRPVFYSVATSTSVGAESEGEEKRREAMQQAQVEAMQQVEALQQVQVPQVQVPQVQVQEQEQEQVQKGQLKVNEKKVHFFGQIQALLVLGRFHGQTPSGRVIFQLSLLISRTVHLSLTQTKQKKKTAEKKSLNWFQAHLCASIR